jgi:predicted dehydrogenase
MSTEVTRVSRRTFLQATTAGVALSAGLRPQASPPQAAPQVTPAGPNDQIVLGMIGVGGMGTARLKGFLQHGDVRIGALCDVDTRHLDRAVSMVDTARGYKPKAVKDYRRVLDDREIDAIVVVTPDHWHAIPTVRGFEAGKDVFVEKPLSYSVAEGRAMADGSVKHKRVSQMGNHIHNDYPNYRRVVELVRSEALGRITRVHVWKTSPTEPYQTTQPPQVPAELDYDFWLGPAPKRAYHPLRSHVLYRHFWDYSGGTFIDFWCHIVDVAVWALDLKAPLNVSAAGGRVFVNDETETPDMLHAVLEYPGLVLTFGFQPTPPPGFDHMGHIGCMFEGTDATVVTNYQRHEVWVKGKVAPDFPRPAPSIPDSPGHLREFLDAIKSRNLETTCNVRYGHRVTKAGLLANIAFRTGRRLHWDDARERFRGDKAADKYLQRKYRRGYKL